MGGGDVVEMVEMYLQNKYTKTRRVGGLPSGCSPSSLESCCEAQQQAASSAEDSRGLGLPNAPKGNLIRKSNLNPNKVSR